MYSKLWTQFETQSLAFGLLRKALYPNYLVRGDAEAIYIYQPTADTNNPTLLLTIYVVASTSKDSSGFYQMSDSVYRMIGGDMAYKAVELVKGVL
jgi:hypothetical protein